ncbi:katanin p80 WD40 repeat-containing subunit B1 homolog KTN80.4-like [Amaranthus tricolor]|uniref:katanin p80 WD40 repeat-containing subunit B1 homolog KTN80.4-like n=1 Tax=Amaranthus tricolor TaxID=29722 RepID=UPI00258D3BE3|nr:katanin p80 WD40 repeat-containing subunit B1 homolog KTN80.4-like [Amaranthus tricolor]
MATKRAYKLQEFVAHTSTVNCLKIGRKSSRILVTGGEDHQVNLWAIGKPNAILSLSGHTSGIDSVSFDSSEVLVAAGAASGTIKLWDLEEAKIVRTLTGHRSNCISVDFHPFGEFFASGSLDTNLKIWDIRRKGCIHTYKGHTRGVNALRFTPDGRWVVSGGEDNTVKLWDLTAGKLMHDFKSHEGQIQCIDFHPHEFLLATGSSDKTVKFWDLETFELIGSAGPETSGVRCVAFNPDGRTLLCGLQESLKVQSWEPIRCHDTVDVGWSKLSDLNVHEGKLLGCSYNQSCVGVWVVDISRIEPYSARARSNGRSELKSISIGNLPAQNESTAKVGAGRLSTSQNTDLVEKETKPPGRLLVPVNSNQINKESNVSSDHIGIPGTPQRINPSISPRNTLSSNAVVLKRISSKSQSTTMVSTNCKADVAPIIVPRDDVRLEQIESKREAFSKRNNFHPSQLKTADFRRFVNANEKSDGSIITMQPEMTGIMAPEMSGVVNKSSMKTESNSSSQPVTSSPLDNFEIRVPKTRKDARSTEIQRAGRSPSLVANWEKRERSPPSEGPTTSSTSNASNVVHSQPNIMKSKSCGYSLSAEKDTTSVTDDDIIAQIIGRHDQFLGSMHSRLGKLQAVHRFWDHNDVKGAIGAMEKMADHSVIADVVSLLTEKTDIVTLEICTCLLPLLAALLGSDMDRHIGISLDMLVKLVRVFGSVIYSAVSTVSSSVGVDIEAEQRLERCNLCYIELERVKLCLPALMRRGGSVAKAAQELNLALSASCE